MTPTPFRRSPYKKGTKNMDINKIKSQVEAELLQLDAVKDVFWDYPAFFTVYTTWGDYHLGDANGCIGWNDAEGRDEGETNATNPQAIAKAFEVWLIAKHERVSI